MVPMPALSLAAHEGGPHVHGLLHEPYGGHPQEDTDRRPRDEGAERVKLGVLLREAVGNEQRSSETEHEEAEFERLYEALRQAGEPPHGLAKQGTPKTCNRALGNGNDGVKAG